MSGWFTTKDGRRFSPQQRKAMARRTKAARERGEIPHATKCNRCGQTEGYVSYHNHDYAHPTKYLEALCWRCHAIWHSQHFAPEACRDYFAEVAKGKMWPPLPRPGWGQLARDHGIVKRSTRKLSAPDACQYCGQNEGLKRFWFGPNDDQNSKVACWWCWIMLWKGTIEKYAIPVRRYWKYVESGHRHAPVKEPAYTELERVYGIPEKS